MLSEESERTPGFWMLIW